MKFSSFPIFCLSSSKSSYPRAIAAILTLFLLKYLQHYLPNPWLAPVTKATNPFKYLNIINPFLVEDLLQILKILLPYLKH